MTSPTICPICDGACEPLDVLDFNKSCEEARGVRLPASGVMVQYVLCADCGFCFAPAMYRWSLEEFSAKVYNDGYLAVDPDYAGVRPRANANTLIKGFGERAKGLHHLDYGGGNGTLSGLLRDAGWSSSSYDPFADRGTRVADLGKFDVISAFEVFEHVPDVKQLMADLSALLVENGVVLFTTLVSDGNIVPGQPLGWWYAAPRNGHISLYSSQSLAFMGTTEGFTLGSYDANFHAFWREIPSWAQGILPAA